VEKESRYKMALFSILLREGEKRKLKARKTSFIKKGIKIEWIGAEKKTDHGTIPWAR